MNESSTAAWKRIPYGMMNFADIRREDCYYVDKSHYIPLIEKADKFFFFIRPRRFGKSLTLSMLQNYYDVLARDCFAELFDGLYIGGHATDARNSYLILSLSFAGIEGGLEGYKQGLDNYCWNRFEDFCLKYAPLLPADTLEKLQMRKDAGAPAQLTFLYQTCQRVGLDIYLFIDEYDHFTNDILSSDRKLQRYTNETHGEGYFRTFFNAVKEGTSSSIKRCFITGVSPVTLDDLTSGFNIGTNYSLSAQFNGLVGFTETEVRAMLAYYQGWGTFRHSIDELIEMMRPWYDNYCFSPDCLDQAPLYNSNMVLYFVKNYIQDGKPPREMIERNIRIDYNKLRMLIRKDKDFGHEASFIQTLVEEGSIVGNIKDGFPASGLTHPDNFISLLYYFGMLTIGGVRRGKIKLVIPNEVVKDQLYGYLLEAYREIQLDHDGYRLDSLAGDLAYDGAWQAYFQYIAHCLRDFSSQRDKQKGEAYVHGFLMAMTSINAYYLPISEADTQAGYPDLFLKPRLEVYPDMGHSYLLELKYIKSSAPEAEVDKLRAAAHSQLTAYKDTAAVRRQIKSTQLHALVVIFKGMELRVCEEV